MKNFILSLLFLASFGAIQAQEPLPQMVYDQFADPTVTEIKMPQGKFTVTKNLPTISRSNVKLDFGGGCILVIDPVKYATLNEVYPIQFASASKNVVFGKSPNGGASRRISQLSGEIKPSTTTLTMVEKTDVQPGETVIIWAGVDKFDPVEPYGHIAATVKSVDAEGVITFTKPLGRAVPNYGSLDAFKTIVAESLRYRVTPWGNWPDDANFSKGYGVSHGLERFNGGMCSNITITGNPTFDFAPITGLNLPNGSWTISLIGVSNVKIDDLTINNPCGVGLFCWRAFGVKATGITITGQGKSKVWNTLIQEAGAISVWGGDDLLFEKIKVNAKDVSAVACEVRVGRLTIKDLDFKCEYTDARNYGNSPHVLGFFSQIETPKVINATLDISHKGGSKPTYQSYWPILWDGQIKFPGQFLPFSFDWRGHRDHQWDGTLTIGGVEYGPQQMVTETIKIPYVAPNAEFKLPMYVRDGKPEGLFLKARFRIKNAGDLEYVRDNMKTYRYNGALAGEWTNFDANSFGDWYGLSPGPDSLAWYKQSAFFFLFRNTVARRSALIELNYTYLPKK